MRSFWVLLAVAAACTSGEGSAPPAAAGLATAFDSTADSVTARVVGEVPAGAVRRLVEEIRIAPAADDTSLFTEVFEFEVDRAGRFWVFDQPSKSIFLFGSDGKLLRRIGRDGSGPGEFRSNNGMVARPDSGIAIWDARNARISFFDRDGAVRTSWITPSGFSTSNGLVTDRSDGLFLRRPVTDPREGEILGRMGLVRLKDGGTFGDSLAPPDLPVQREVYLAVNVQGKNRNQSSTSSRYAPNYFWAWHPDGYFVAGHGGRFEVVVARTGAKPVTIRRELPPVPVGEDERADETAAISYNMRQTQADWSWSGPALPTTKAPLLGVHTTRDGRIWTRVAVPSVRIPDDEITVPRDPKQPVTRHRTPVVYEVFEPTGRFLGRVDCACRITLIDAEGDRVWAIVRDESDLPAVVRFRVEPGWR